MVQSPQGGTTSLPEYLQKRKPAPQPGQGPQTKPSMQPEAPGGRPATPATPAQPGAPGGAVPPAPIHEPNIGLPKPIVPPPPPPPAPPAAPPAPYAYGPGAKMMSILGGQPPAAAAPGGASLSNPQPTAPAAPWGPTYSPQAQQKFGVDPGGHPVPPPSPAAPPPAPTPPPAGGATHVATPPMTVDPGYLGHTQQPGFTGQAKPGDAVGMDKFSGVLEQILGQAFNGQGRYSNELIDNMRTQMTNQNNDLRKSEEDRAIADASKRGVYYGTPLTNSLGDLSERYVQRQSEGENALLKQVADARAQDLQTAMGSMFQFGQGEMQNNQLQQNQQNNQFNQMIALAQLAQMGGPTIPGAVGDFSTLPQPGQMDMSEIYKWLGTLWGQKPQTPAPAAAA